MHGSTWFIKYNLFWNIIAIKINKTYRKKGAYKDETKKDNGISLNSCFFI